MVYEYKDSGIEWIGKVPTHWKIERLKDISILVETGYTPPTTVFEYYENGTIPWYGPSSFSGVNYLSEPVKLINEIAVVNREVKIFNKGSLFIIGIGATIGKVALINESSSCNQQINVFEPNKRIYPEYLLYFMKRYEAIIIKIAQFTTLPIFNQMRLGILNILVPPKHEQIAIANYLDKACTDIERVIEIKQRQIENLQQQLKSLISNWFTIGNHYKLKSTDNIIIPEIPEHWNLLKLKRVLEEKLKYGANESGDLDNPDDPRYIRITDFDDDGSLRDDTFKSLPIEVAKEYLLSEGDVLFARSGATVGKTFIFKNYKGIACYAGYLIKAVTLKYKMLPDYLYYYTKTKMYEDWKNLIFTQATIQNIGADKYQYLPIPVPPIDEQKEILRKALLLSENIKKSQSNIEKQIDVLLNYKKSLIHEVVTGKKQVYGLAEETLNK